MKQPEPITHETPWGTATIKDRSQLIKISDGRRAIKANMKIDGLFKDVGITYDDKPELLAKIEAWLAEWDSYEAAKKAQFEENVPGYHELSEAEGRFYDERQRYNDEFEDMMSDEDNDGANPPEAYNSAYEKKAKELAKQYPRAAMYLYAEGYTMSNNVYKYSAGKDAMKLIAEGGSLEEASEILKNWLPKDAID